MRPGRDGANSPVLHRIERHGQVSTELALRSDRALGALLDDAGVSGTGIGGSSVVLDVGGTPVFAKRVPLTDLERRPDNVMSTANLFELPAICQYGVGSPGFGVWRELAANVMATNWVLGGHSGSFPLLHHWRVLPGAPSPAREHADIDRDVAYWGGSPAVRERLRALRDASASVVLFSEYVPHTLADWLHARGTDGQQALAAACAMVESELLDAVTFMNDHGFMHFDAHFGNVLTDGRNLYLADLGLATSPRFDRTAEEARFAERNRTHDIAYAMMRLVNWSVTTACGIPAVDGEAPVRRNAYVRDCADGAEPVGAPAVIASVIRRYAPVAAAMNDFYGELFGTSREAPYPAGRIGRALPIGEDLLPVGPA